MKNYRYTAMDARGKEQRGHLKARDQQDANAQLKEQGLFPTGIQETAEDPPASLGQTPKRKKTAKRPGAGLILGTPRMKRKHLTLFTRQMAILLRAGLPLVRALRTLEDQVQDISSRLVIGDVADDVEGGRSFSEALAEHPKTFNEFYINMVKAGEASGAMEQVLQRLAGYMEKAARLRGKVKSALTYPVCVMAVALLITTGLLYFVVPKFARMFEDILGGQPLPLPTRVVIAISEMLQHHALMLLGMTVLLAICFKLAHRTRLGRKGIDSLCLRLPPFGGLVRKSAVARVTATLSTLMSAGVSILNALTIARDTAGNLVVAGALQQAHDAVKEGEVLSRPLRTSKVFPGMVCSMIQVGEETGALPDMLGQIAEVYEEEVDLAVDSLTSLIEPLMIVILGLMIGGIVMALFLPILSIIGAF